MQYYIKYYRTHYCLCKNEHDLLNFNAANEIDENLHFLEITKAKYDELISHSVITEEEKNHKDSDKIIEAKRQTKWAATPAKPIKTAQQIANIQAKKAQKAIDDNKKQLEKELIDKQIKVDAMKKLEMDTTKEDAELIKLKDDYAKV